VEHTGFSEGDTVADEVEVDFHVLCALMLHGVGGQVHCREVVAVDNSSTRRWTMELHEQLTEPARLGDAVGDAPVFRLGAGARDGLLTLRGPGHQIVAEEDAETGGELARVRAPRPVGVRVGNQVRRRGGVKLEAEVGGAMDVPEYALDEHKTGLARIMHEEANLLDGIGQVRASECKVLQSAGDAAVKCGIGKGATILARDFGLGVYGSGNWLTLKHFGTIKNFKCILLLRQKEAGGVFVDVDTEEVMHFTKVTHVELTIEGRDDAVKQGSGVANE
jgi:hypothetical protein